jgi:hypothetical protein
MSGNVESVSKVRVVVPPYIRPDGTKVKGYSYERGGGSAARPPRQRSRRPASLKPTTTAKLEGDGSEERPYKVRDAKTGLRLIAAGKHVEMDKDTVGVVLDKLASIGTEAFEAKKSGKKLKVPNFNLCLVHVPGANLFCEEDKDIPRLKMPQVKGENIRAGSDAEKLLAKQNEERRKAGKEPTKEVDATEEYISYLKENGLDVSDSEVASDRLKATQNELVGDKVASMMSSTLDPGSKFDATEGSIFTSSDNYVVDGHHRWAAAVSLKFKKGGPAPQMKVQQINAPIERVLELTNKFVKEFGIEGNAANTLGKGAPPCIGCGEVVKGGGNLAAHIRSELKAKHAANAQNVGVSRRLSPAEIRQRKEAAHKAAIARSMRARRERKKAGNQQWRKSLRHAVEHMAGEATGVGWLSAPPPFPYHPKGVGHGSVAKAMPNPKSSPKEIAGSHGHKPHGKSILWPAMYEELRAKGHSKTKAAAISNAAWNKKHGAAGNATSTRVTKANGGRVWVPPHAKADGTRVKGYWQDRKTGRRKAVASSTKDMASGMKSVNTPEGRRALARRLQSDAASSKRMAGKRPKLGRIPTEDQAEKMDPKQLAGIAIRLNEQMERAKSQLWAESNAERERIKATIKKHDEPIPGVIVKTDDDKQLVFGWMYVTHDRNGEVVVDKSGDFVDDVTELEDAAIEFVLDSRAGGVEHRRDGDGPMVASRLVESVVFTPEKLEALGLEAGTLPSGWWAGWRVDDPDVWADVRANKYRGFSIHGAGVREAV